MGLRSEIGFGNYSIDEANTARKILQFTQSGYSFLVIKSSCLYAHSQVLGGLPIEGDFLDIKYPEDLCIDYHS